MDTLKDIQNAYEAWIVEHPEAIGDLQKSAKWLDFFLSRHVSTARKLSKIIYHFMKDYNYQIIRRPHDLVDPPPSKDMETYTLENFKNVCEAWIVEHPKAFNDLKKIIIILASSLAGAASSKVVLSRVIYHLMVDYNNRIIKRSHDAKKSGNPLRSKL